MARLDDTRFRAEILASCGASGETITELLAYTGNPFEAKSGFGTEDFPLPDEPHLDAWTSYEEEARRVGTFEALKKRFVQLRFPIRQGMSQEEGYRKATKRGLFEAATPNSPGITLSRPSGLALSICPTIAGKLPVIVVDEREDFVTMVRAFTNRNEPVPVPSSMGACIVTGFNNWDRISTYRREWERERGGTQSEEEWALEFQRLVPQKSLYQDRFIILSSGPYSGASAADVGFDADAWLAHSLTIRREHEFTHYFTYRVFGVMRNHLLDELIADFVGLVRALGRYGGELALRFLGLESYPACRKDGRLHAYRGEPPLSDAATKVLCCLAYRAVQNLERFSIQREDELQSLGGLARLTFALAGLTLEEMASTEMLDRVSERLR